MDPVEGRVAVITGASRGLGAGMAEEFQKRGLRLGLCSRGAPALPESERVLCERVDVSREAAVEAFSARCVERFGRIDLWVNNAGVLDPIAPLRDVETGDFWRHLEINLLGVFLGTRSFVRHVRGREGEGVLVNISSGAARKAYHGWSAYCAGKAAVDRMTECVDLEERTAGLRALSLAPGVIDTDMQANIRACSPDQFADVQRFRERDDWSSPSWVAREILALAFDPERRSDTVIQSTEPEPTASR